MDIMMRQNLTSVQYFSLREYVELSKSKKMIKQGSEQNKDADSNHQQKESDKMQQENMYLTLLQLQYDQEAIKDYCENHLEIRSWETLKKIRKQFCSLSVTEQESVLNKIDKCISYCQMLRQVSTDKSQIIQLIGLISQYELFESQLKLAKKNYLPVNKNAKNQNIQQVNHVGRKSGNFSGNHSTINQSPSMKSSLNLDQQTKSSYSVWGFYHLCTTLLQSSLRSRKRQSNTKISKNGNNSSTVKQTEKNQEILQQISNKKEEEEQEQEQEEETLINYDHSD